MATRTTKTNLRRHGEAPYRLAVLHGGPGGAGEVRPVAEELAGRGYGVLEPLRTQHTVADQLAELRAQLSQHADIPTILIGWSWGAWLGCLLAAEHVELVDRLVLIGSGPLKAEDARQIAQVWKSRSTDGEWAEFEELFDNAAANPPETIQRMIHLSNKSQGFELIERPDIPVDFDRAIFDAVWSEAAALRQSGELLRRVQAIRCPVHVIHGDRDPHPAEAVRGPMRAAVSDFEFVLLGQCGHKPWLERHARDQFFAEIERIVSSR